MATTSSVMRPSTILNVDDDEAGRYAITKVLSRAGFSVREAATGARALELAAERPDLIILDVNLPDIDGFEVCRRLRANPATRDIAILHLSATAADSASRTRGLEGGADGYLVHPVEPPELIATIKALLRARRVEPAAHVRAHDWEGAFDAIGDAVCLVDAAGNVLRSNRAAADLAGVSADDLVGRSFTERLTQGGGADAIARVMETGQREILELALDKKRVLLAVDPFVRLDGVKGCVCVLTSVPAVPEPTPPSGIPLGAMYASNSVGVVFWEEDRSIRDANEAFLAMIGHSRDHLARGLSFADLVAVDSRDKLDKIFEELRAAGSCPPVECTLVTREGKPVPVLFAGCSFEDSPRRGVAVIVDMSERRRAEERGAQLVRELRETIRSRDEFLAMATHDLRSPLTALKLRLHAILRGAKLGPAGSSLPERVAERLEAADRQLDEVSRITNHLLDITALSASGHVALRREPLDLVAVTRDVLARLRDEVRASGASVSLQAPERYEGTWDRLRVEQILTNLVSNALKYGDRKPVIVAIEPADKTVRLIVRDQGIGIEPAQHQKIFELFSRGTPARAEGSFGVGLWIVKRLTEAMNGTVSLESQAGNGSTFTITLPR